VVEGGSCVHAIETFSLSKNFRRVSAVRDLNLQVPEGAVYALMGPNGAGKTTLIKLLMNLIGPSAGRATMLGVSTNEIEGRRLEEIGYVSENQKLPDWMSVEVFLAYCRPFYPRWDRAFEKHLTERFELPLKRKLKSLSRGMKMKAALTSALAFHPKLIVLDEPLSGLDPLVRDDLMESLLSLRGETTVLFSSHDLAEIESFASYVGYMDGGRLLISEPIASVRERFRHVAVSADTPLAQPAALPGEWRGTAIDGASARWVESSFDAERSHARAQQVFGEVRMVSSPLTLREVFLAMARGSRNRQANGAAQ
jgi:ABC-2 type transport system ATP-binding protein